MEGIRVFDHGGLQDQAFFRMGIEFEVKLVI
jgi:hypothetical protein